MTCHLGFSLLLSRVDINNYCFFFQIPISKTDINILDSVPKNSKLKKILKSDDKY